MIALHLFGNQQCIISLVTGLLRQLQQCHLLSPSSLMDPILPCHPAPPSMVCLHDGVPPLSRPVGVVQRKWLTLVKRCRINVLPTLSGMLSTSTIPGVPTYMMLPDIIGRKRPANGSTVPLLAIMRSVLSPGAWKNQPRLAATVGILKPRQ
jgi:hypothetical protein